MNAAELRAWLSGSYRFDMAREVFTPARPRAFAYSDGAESEAWLAGVMREAHDRAVGSTELAARIRDWPSRYHLSPARQNLLRPVACAMRGLVLEVGAGCGAITRQLGESGATVLAVEGSLERAAIAAARCRDLPNVVVVCDNFAALELPWRFDLVTLVGVLEYSPMFLEGEDPVQEMLARARALLADDGLLALAIENQLGLKYLAGAREDHFGIAYHGVTDRYGPKTPVTFGEAELRGRLSRAGFGCVQGLYPFPDYKMPAVLLTEAGFADARLNAADLIASAMRRHEAHEGPRAFSEPLARGVFVRNGLGAATANSFLFLAARDEAARGRMPDASVLAFAYSADRARAYAKEMRLAAAPAGVRVLRRPLYEVAPAADAPVRQRLEDEDYVGGELLHRGIERLVAGRGWSVADVADRMRPVAELLAARASHGKLAPEYLDCTPFNVIRRPDGTLATFDLEWLPGDGAPLDVARVAFRGLWNSLARVDDVAPPAPGTPLDVCSLTLAVMERLGLAAGEEQALEWIRGEHAISGTASGLGIVVPEAIPRFNVGGLAAPAQAAFRVQVYYHGNDEGYAEVLSVSASCAFEGGRAVARLELPAREKPYARVRVDPMDRPGIVRIDRIAVADARGAVTWETRRCRPPDLEHVNQLRDLSALVPSDKGTVWLSEGIDPYFDLALGAGALASLGGGGTVTLEMARLDAAEWAALGRLAGRDSQPFP